MRATHLNPFSSRSHLLFMMFITQVDKKTAKTKTGARLFHSPSVRMLGLRLHPLPRLPCCLLAAVAEAGGCLRPGRLSRCAGKMTLIDLAGSEKREKTVDPQTMDKKTMSVRSLLLISAGVVLIPVCCLLF